MTEDEKRLADSAARAKEAQVAALAEKLFVAMASSRRGGSAYDAFDDAVKFVDMKEERWEKVAR